MTAASLRRGEKWQTQLLTEMQVGKAIPENNTIKEKVSQRSNACQGSLLRLLHCCKSDLLFWLCNYIVQLNQKIATSSLCK